MHSDKKHLESVLHPNEREFAQLQQRAWQRRMAMRELMENISMELAEESKEPRND